MFLSVVDIFKIGIGPSSSHTMGPMNAAARFLDEIAAERQEAATAVVRLSVSLHGSLAYTGIGHGTDNAVILGPCGHRPEEIDPDAVAGIVESVAGGGQVSPPGHPRYRFDPSADLVLDRGHPLPGHANGMVFTAFDADDHARLQRTYYSIGGGFVVTDRELEAIRSGDDDKQQLAVPFPFTNAAEMLAMAAESGLAIAAMKRRNEEAMGHGDIGDRLDGIWSAMRGCIDRGLRQEGRLPGGLNVARRARAIHHQLNEKSRLNQADGLSAMDWMSAYAIAVNEENASGGRIVTAPTNGAAGVIPAVLQYHLRFHTGADRQAVRDFLLTAAAIGGIIKHNASISGAEMGCQGEVGTASAMAAAGLAAVLGATPGQIENAAEIALEHHLGMTCDPVGGLVQIPCIERNALGAVKAAAAASLALKGDGEHVVSLDACIETMRQTGVDMHGSYKETSLGGLAVNVAEC